MLRQRQPPQKRGRCAPRGARVALDAVFALALSASTSCAFEPRAAERFLDPQLRARGIAYPTVQSARAITAGPWKLQRARESALALPPSGQGATFETPGDGRARQDTSYVFQTFDTRTNEPVATTACAAARRQGPAAALASAAELPSDEVSLSCLIEVGETTFSLTLRGRLDQNLWGTWRESTPTSSPAPMSVERRGGRVEVLLHHEIWGRVPARTPTAIIQLFAENPGESDAASWESSKHSIRAVAAATFGRHGTLWMSPSLDEIASAGAVSILGAHLFAPFPWEQAS